MARTYAEFVSLVRNWANRDTAALSDSVIQDCLRYAADKAYRKLRISQLEATVTYDSASLIAATTPGNGLIPSKTNNIRRTHRLGTCPRRRADEETWPSFW